MKIKYYLLLFTAVLGLKSHASDLKVSTPILYLEEQSAFAVFNLSWSNAWKNDRNNDAVWLFAKSVALEGGYRHIKILADGHEIISSFGNENPNLEFQPAQDGVGLFLLPGNSFRGDVEVTVKMILDPVSFQGLNNRNSSLQVIGIEMVQIPAGGFTLGDPSARSQRQGALFKPKKGDYDGLVSIASEDQAFTVGPEGDIYYQASGGYEGDQGGPIPATYPKGVQEIYIMKYEPTEGQYTQFLNSLTPEQSASRNIIQADGYAIQGGSITEGTGFETSFSYKPCPFIGWDDSMAFADWAGLRPMTEFEFTKAARGPQAPADGGFPWGTSRREQVQRLPNPNGELVMLNGWDESKLSDDTKAYFGASHYWVMDLAGSMWERMVTIGHELGRQFTGSHGDGQLSDNGYATNEDWPVGDENTGGIGFRGGGFYGYSRDYHEFNPFSPIAYRTYGGWQGVKRTRSYGARFVRTSD